MSQVIIDGLLLGFQYSLIAMGLSLVWGVLNILNFAHGEFLMLGMFISYWLATSYGVDPSVSVVIAGAALFLLGVLTYKIIIKRVLRGVLLAQLTSTFGLSIFLVNIVVFFWTSNYRVVKEGVLIGKRIDLGGYAVIGVPQLAAAIGSILVALAIFYVMKWTKIGIAIRAVAHNASTASLIGINTEFIYLLTFGISAASVGMAGALLSTFQYIYPQAGGLFGLVAFSTVAFGGFGSVPGAFVAGILMGLLEALGGYYIGPAYKYVVIFSVYLIVVLVKPTGLMGE